MKVKGIILAISLLAITGLVAGVFGCATPEITPTSSPTPTLAPTSQPTPTLAPTPTPSKQPTQPAKIKWKGQDQYVVGAPFAHWPYGGPGYIHLYWAKFLKDISDGQIEAEVLDPGTIVPATEQMEAVSKGILDFGFINYPGFYASKYPEVNVEIGLPFAWTRPEEYYDAIMYWGLYKEFQDFYEKELNVHILPVTTNSYYHFGTTFPVDTPDAIKGKKIRALGIYGDYVKALGGSPTVIPQGEAYMALKLGTIDGYIGGISWLEAVKLKEVLKFYVTEPNTNVVAGNAVINLDRWKELPEKVKYMYDTWGFHVMYSAATEGNQFETYMAVDAMKNYGLKTVKWSSEDTARVFTIGIGLWDSVAQTNARAAKWVQIVKDQAKALGKIK